MASKVPIEQLTPWQFSIVTLSIIATMHRLAAMLVLFSCFLLLATHAHQHSQSSAISGNTQSRSCLPHERDALLAFKHGVTSDPEGFLNSWRRDDGHGEQLDCCRWRGVRCSNRTGHVHRFRLPGASLDGQISPSLLALDHLEHLDLSWNTLEGPTGRIPEFLGSLKSLTYLNLCGIPFHGGVPPQLGNLSRLQYLDLSSIEAVNSTDLSWLTRLPSIQYLNFNRVDLSTVVDWPHVMNMLPSLRALHLSHCSLANANQSLPHLNLTNLEYLDASYNFFDHPMVTSWFWNLTSLKYLNLHSTWMFGQFPDALGDMTSLRVLDLSGSGDSYSDDDEENMRIMTADLKNLCDLKVLYISSSYLHGDVTELFKNLPRCSPNKLQKLDLSQNQLTGMLPTWMGQLTSLIILNLGSNNITGPLPTSVGQFTALQTLNLSINNLSGNLPYEIGMLSNVTCLDLSINNLNGNVPHEIGMLSSLTYLDLDSNKLDGVITEEHLVSARSLEFIDLSNNALKIEISSDWQPPSSLYIARFAACQMGPLFPRWLQWHMDISELDISSAGIADRLPQWFSHAFSTVELMDISNNQVNGTLPTDMGSMSLLHFYLHSNQLTGQIPTLPPNITNLDLSNNFLSGPLPSATGSARLARLSLSSNQIPGHITKSFCKFHTLFTLDLSNNSLEGKLPSCLGEMKSLRSIVLSNNNLSGEFPSFVQNLDLLILDLSRNKFSGGLPMWIGELASLMILSLSHNKFYGNVPVNITNLPCLQYIDLSNNKISGPLPSYFSNLEIMRCGLDVDDYTNSPCSCRWKYDDYRSFTLTSLSPYLRSLSMVFKGRELSYGSAERVVGTSMMSIDLSSNNLIGEIPEEIVVLDELVNLNLSWNHLTGVIPNKIGEMRSLQSLDLSRNKLSGEIPVTMPNLTFLSDLDLSYNNLTGRIPSGAQLDTLFAEYPSMYYGNIGLCGHPLSNSCWNEGDAPKQGGLGRTEEGHGIDFFYLGLGCGFVVGTWMALGALLFKRSWRIACFRLSDKLCDKVYVLVAVWARQTGTDHHA